MKAARAAVLVLAVSMLPAQSQAGSLSLFEVPSGAVRRASGPLTVSASTIVVDGTLHGAAGRAITLNASQAIVVRGRILAGPEADVTLSAPVIRIERDALVSAGDGGAGADRSRAGAAGGDGGDLILETSSLTVRGVLHVGDGGRGGSARGMAAFGGAAGRGGALIYGNVDSIRERVSGGNGGAGGDAIALPPGVAGAFGGVEAACQPAPAGSTGKAGNRPQAAKPATATTGDGTDGASVTSSGGNGADGVNGAGGTGGAPGAFGFIAAGAGADGGEGCPGHKGGDGGKAQAIGGAGGDATIGRGGDGGDASAAGGNGGKGGRGGAGGTGGRGGPAVIALGGPGGNGGKGGAGGAGGNGGDACAQAGAGGNGGAGDGAAGTAAASPGAGGTAGGAGPAGAAGAGGTSAGNLTNGPAGNPGQPGVAGVAGTAGAAVAAPCLANVQVSADPYSGGSGQHATQVEPDSFAYGSTIVTTFQTARIFDGGAMNIGWATSKDGGISWSYGFLPNVTTIAGGPWDRASDSVVSYDAAHGVWMIQSLGISATGGVAGRVVLVSRSTDGGTTWTAPVTVAGGPTGNLDKNWIVCDNWTASPYYGRCYSTWDDHGAGNRMEMSTSTNGGLTWGPVLRPADNAGGLGGVPAVLPDGTVVVPYQTGWAQVRSFRSTNGGASWTASQPLATVTYHVSAGSLRAPPLPSAEVSGDGRIYVAWQDCRFRAGCAANDIVYSTTTDGQTWTTPVRIPIVAVTDAADFFTPGIAVDIASSGGSTRLFVAHYSYAQSACGSACALQPGYSYSDDAGATWTSAPVGEPFPVTWAPNTSQGRMVGDYISASFVTGGRALPVWARGYAPAGGVFDLGIETIMGGVDVTATAAAVASRVEPVVVRPGRTRPDGSNTQF